MVLQSNKREILYNFENLEKEIYIAVYLLSMNIWLLFHTFKKKHVFALSMHYENDDFNSDEKKKYNNII